MFQIALERDGLDTWLEDLRVLTDALENQGLSALLDAPHVPAARKMEALRQSLGDSVGPLALNLASMLASRNLAHLVPGVLDEYQRLLDAHRGIERAEVITAVPLGSDQWGKIVELLQCVAGKEIRLKSVVEPQILGGMIARVGDRLIDGSIRTKLEEMRRGIAEQVS